VEVVPFDWQRMFIGDEPPLYLLEIAFRTAVLFGFLLLAAKFIGKRALAELTPFEFFLVVALGSAAGDPMFHVDVPLLHGMVVIAVIVGLERLVQRMVERSRAVHDAVVGNPTLLIKDGAVFHAALVQERLNEEDVFMHLRQEGIRDLGEVEQAYLEHSGEISIFKADKPHKLRNILPEQGHPAIPRG
jgi:uncharacterized membrane protein YcaP (DUF421 family)